MIELKGIAWNHTRGFVSVVATAQRYEELYPAVRIGWEKRSIQAFADASMEMLARTFDLIVMDHPHIALAAESGVLLPLDRYLEAEFLEDQARHSVGASHRSYCHESHQWALAIDAATPISTWRPDLMEKHGLGLPQTWEDVLELAGAGHVAVPLFPVDVLMHLYMLCDALGQPAFQDEVSVAPDDALTQALDCLRTLGTLCRPECFERNPVQTAEHMTQTDEVAYCPFGYGYSNYSRPRYGRRLLQAGGLVSFRGKPLRSTLGGAGLAVSAKTEHLETCVDYARLTADPQTQAGIYFEAGGQPGHRAAWTDDRVNGSCSNFFGDTLETLDQAILRPAYAGYMHFQDQASPVAHAYVTGKGGIDETVASLNRLYRHSRDVKIGRTE